MMGDETWKPFNMNQCVKVRLTDKGKRVLKEKWENLLPHLSYRLPEEDAEGYSKWQMWSLMIMLGFDVPFDPDILIEVDE